MNQALTSIAVIHNQNEKTLAESNKELDKVSASIDRLKTTIQEVEKKETVLVKRVTQIETGVAYVAKMEKELELDARERARQAALLKSFAGAMAAAAATPFFPIFAGAFLGGNLNLAFFALNQRQFDQDKCTQKFALCIISSLGASVIGGAASPILASCERKGVIRFAIQTGANSLHTIFEKSLKQEELKIVDLFTSAFAAIGGSVASAAAHHFLADSKTVAEQIVLAGISGAANAGTNRVILNALEGEPLFEGVSQVMLISALVAGVVKASYIREAVDLKAKIKKDTDKQDRLKDDISILERCECQKQVKKALEMKRAKLAEIEAKLTEHNSEHKEQREHVLAALSPIASMTSDARQTRNITLPSVPPSKPAPHLALLIPPAPITKLPDPLPFRPFVIHLPRPEPVVVPPAPAPVVVVPSAPPSVAHPEQEDATFLNDQEYEGLRKFLRTLSNEVRGVSK